jgi:hypothetical protein
VSVLEVDTIPGQTEDLGATEASGECQGVEGSETIFCDVEFSLMSSSGAVQVGGGNTTYVSRPANCDVYRQQAAPGSYCAAFDVPSRALFAAGFPGSAQIPGPGHRLDVLATARGKPIPRPVPALNIVHVETK